MIAETNDTPTSDDNDSDNGPLYPDIKVQLSGKDENAFSIIGRCLAACKRGDIATDEVAEFKRQAMAGDYDELLRTCMNWFECS